MQAADQLTGRIEATRTVPREVLEGGQRARDITLALVADAILAVLAQLGERTDDMATGTMTITVAWEDVRDAAH